MKNGKSDINPNIAIKVNRAIKLNFDFQFNKYIEYRAQPKAAPRTNKSPIVKFKLIKKFKLPLDIIVKTPAIQINKPNILKKLIFSLKNKIDKKIIITGEDV